MLSARRLQSRATSWPTSTTSKKLYGENKPLRIDWKRILGELDRKSSKRGRCCRPLPSPCRRVATIVTKTVPLDVIRVEFSSLFWRRGPANDRRRSQRRYDCSQRREL